MIINRSSLRKKTKILVILVFILILPTFINILSINHDNSYISENDQRIIEKDPIQKLDLHSSSSNLPNAHYFSHYKAITIDHTKIEGTGSHTNFPVLISILDSDLHDNAQPDGDDIAFANSTDWLDHEIELYNPSYSATEAQLIAWVRIPLLSTSINTTIFMLYGNNSMTSRENPTGVWNSNYKGVWHLKENPGYGGSAQDSTIYGNDGIAINMESTDQVTGQIDGSFRFNGWDEYVNVGNVASDIKNIEFWINADALSDSIDSQTSYQNPTATGETYNSWTNPTNAYTSNNIRASASGFNPRQDYYNFGFNIPSDVNILGIEVSIEGRAIFQGDSAQCSVELSGNGGSNYYAPFNNERTWWSTLDSYQSVGGPTEDWGKPGGWLPSDFSNTNFRVRLTESGYDPLEVDHVRVRIFYSILSDMPLIALSSTAQIKIDNSTHEIKTLGFPGTPDIFVNASTDLSIIQWNWYHIVINDPTGIDVSALTLSRVSSDYFDGTIDEFRLSNVVRSQGWITTEYNNQYDPNSFYYVGAEKTLLTDVEVRAFDLYGNKIPNVNISMIKNNNLIRWDLADANGTVLFEHVISVEDRYNFSVSMKSNISPYQTIEINRTSEAILIEGGFQTINLICNLSRNIFNVVDIDGNQVDSGWIIVGTESESLQNCTIDSTGHATFRWLKNTPYDYNYTIWYRDSNYNPNKIIIGSGDITIPNSKVNVTVILTTVNFTINTKDDPQPVGGAKIILDNLNSGEDIVNLTTDLYGKAKLRWFNSSGISSNYSLSISFYGQLWNFEIPELMTGVVKKTNFTVKAKAAYNISIYFAPAELAELETLIVSLNPTTNIQIEWGSKLTLRALFNVTKVPSGYENLTGPTYANPMLYQILEGTTLILSGIMPKDDFNIGRHQVEIETDDLESAKIYIIKIIAQKSGYVLPPEIIMSLHILENELVLNQSENDDSAQSIYWQEYTEMSVKPYGKISETFSIEYNIFNSLDHTFKFSIPDLSNDWILSRIVFNIYNVTFGVSEGEINLNITDDDGIKYIFNSSNSNYYYFSQWATNGSWTNLEIYLNKPNIKEGATFNFIIDGTFVANIDIIAKAYFTRDSIDVQYSRFNVTNSISILTEVEGWSIKNITFLIYNCYNTSTWNKVDLSSLNILNITTNEGYEYPLNYGDIDGNGILTIDDRIIYPLDSQFLFTLENNLDLMFDVIILVEYIQEFYQNQYLELINIVKTEYNFNNGGTLSINFVEESWIEDYAILEITGISNGPEDLLPSELEMNITVGGQTYNVLDVIPGEGMFPLESLTKNNIYTAIIETNQPVIFNLSFIIKYSRSVSYETIGTVSYYLIEQPEISGEVQYYEELGYYILPINTTLIDANEYTVRFTVDKENYISAVKDLNMIVLDRLTLINGSSGIFRKIETIYVNEAVNFTLLYTDAIKGTKITDLVSKYYIWEKYDADGNVIDTGQGSVIPSVDNLYILDFDTENLTIGNYFLFATIGKDNYDYKNALISLSIEKRIISFSLGSDFKNNQINVKKGKTVTIELQLIDPTKGDIPLTNATITALIEGTEYSFQEFANGVYRLGYPTGNIEAFFTSKTLTGVINISKEDYYSVEVSITIVVEMEEIFPGLPTFYFILIVSGILGIVGSITVYRLYKRAKIPTFVKKVRSIKKLIKAREDISDSLVYRSKDTFIGEILSKKWDKLGLSLEEIMGIKFEKIQKSSKRSISILEKVHEQKPLGMLLMKWDERIGTEILTKYPEDIDISTKTLMQIYSTHEYSGEKGVITLMDGIFNIISYYSGPEKGYYLVLLLNLDDDPDAYEDGMAAIFNAISQNIDDDSYIHLIPLYFQTLSHYPILNEEQLYMLTYYDDIKRMIINTLRDTGIVAKSELAIWFKDKYQESFIDLDALLNELMKRDLIKQISMKGMPSELILLTMDIILQRIPPTELLESASLKELPPQLVNNYKDEIKKYFKDYRPTEEDNIKVVSLLINPQIYLTFRLLRTSIVTIKDLEKLQKKGVEDVYSILKTLWENQVITVFQDDNNNEYYALLTDFYVDLLFPKYLLRVIRELYKQKSKTDKVLIEYLNTLEDKYFDLKAQDKLK